ncbi:MAG: class I SAM-dependent methyltransferase [Chloroflexota bacterium]|nr:class I SAM-dependent methyltransferase [Chloroflexota bacterium]
MAGTWQSWQWDETLFLGSAPYYVRGRLPYAPALAAAMQRALALDGTGRLIDAGCGPGIVALRLAHLFDEVAGVDPDAGMLAEAERRARELGVRNARWVKARAEELPLDLGTFRVATFAASFHWMDRDRVAAIVREMLEPGGAFVQVTDVADDRPEQEEPLPYPAPPREAIEEIKSKYLGPQRRAGQSIRVDSPSGEAEVLARAGFGDPERICVPFREVILRSVEDIVAWYYSCSDTAPHLFGDRLAEFDADMRAALAKASPSGRFAERTEDTKIIIWRKS